MIGFLSIDICIRMKVKKWFDFLFRIKILYLWFKIIVKYYVYNLCVVNNNYNGYIFILSLWI